MSKTFGLVQKGNGKISKSTASGSRSGSVSYRAPANTEADAETNRRQEVRDRNELDRIMGFEQYLQGPERLGWLVNMHPTVVYETDQDAGKSGVDLYFIQEDGATFKATVLYQPYFYIICKPGSEPDVEDYLRRRFSGVMASVQRVEKEDLSLPNHLLGHQRTLIKLSFINNQDLLSVRRVIQPAAERNKRKQETTGVYEEVQQYLLGFPSFSQNRLATYGHDKPGKGPAKSSHEALENVLDLREFDIQYYMRVAIDCDLRVGLWYAVKALQGQITINSCSDKITRADPVVLAFDIETTKLPLKFPDSTIDCIMMISYMVDGQGFLITNREIVSEDIFDFDYTPKPEFEGPFIIFNEDDEVSLLRRFFEHIRDLKPSIVVTYNGDFFDFPFIDARAKFHNLDMRKEVGFYKDPSGEYKSFNAMHMDCFCWVKRDSYLPQGSQGLKAVTTAKLGYNPMELDPEDMTRFASEQPQTLAQYSVSDAVATYYLYMKYVHPFIFSLCNIIPMNPDDVLRRGSGTLCEHLLMVQAFKANVIMPNKHSDDTANFFQGHLLESETYVGGHVEALEAGVFRSDIPTKFRLVPDAFQQLINEVDQALKFSIVVEGKLNLDDVLNYEEVKSEIVSALEELRDTPNRIEAPSIYHLDVAAMYPNIILTNRLQPDAVIDESTCASCDFNQGPNSSCQRRMEWSWRGEYFPAKRSEYNMIRNQLEQEKFPGRFPKDPQRSFHDMTPSEQNTVIKKRLSDYSRKVYNRIHETTVIQKESIACQRENPFYINTVQNFRDRRYEYKGLLKVWKKKADQAANEGDTTGLDEAKRLIVVYDSLQLAHKCILNSFYGYVMRKGARWYNMEMAGIVCLTGARIIQLARSRVEQIGRPLELDTDGIWCILPATFPENFAFKLKSGKVFPLSYPCVMLNHLVHDQFTNHQYQELEDDVTKAYSIRSENSIFFEVDGPYRAMILPSSTEEDKLLKKRYAVFNDDGTLAELKGFEIKRRGELKLIKIFQSEIFKSFLLGNTLDECYASVAVVANRWLDVLYSKGMEHTDEELFDLISENRSMSKSLEEYGAQKSTSISTAKRLAEFLGDQMVKDKGLNCKFIISTKPVGAPVSERAIPVVIFQAEPSIRKHFLRKWLKDNSLVTFDIRDIVDWQYYMERFGSVIQKLITIPAAMQGVRNPVPRIRHPDWLFKRVAAMDDKIKQVRITDMFSKKSAVELDAPDPGLICGDIGDLEDVGQGSSAMMPVAISALAAENKAEGPAEKPTPMPDMYTEYHAWLKFQKIKWKKRRLERQKEREVYGRDYERQKKALGVDKNGMAGFLHRQSDNILRYPWQVLQIAETDIPGDFRVWAIIKDNIYPIKLTVPRIFYVNSRYHDTRYDQESTVYHVSRVVKTLPRSQPCLYLHEFVMPESFYRENAGQFSQLFNHENIEGVYELQVPLLHRAMVQLGCVLSVQKHRVAHQRVLDASFELDDLKRDTKSKASYLLETGSSLHYLLLFHSMSENGTRQIFGLFSAPSQVMWVFVVDPGQNRDAIPNIKKLYADKKAEREGIPTTQSADIAAMADMLQYPESFDVRLSLHSRERDALAALNRAFREYQDQRRGPTIVALQSAQSTRHLQMMGMSVTQDFPILSVPFHKKDNTFPAIGWQTYSIRRMMDHYLNLNDFLKDRLALSRYGDVPICNIDHDYTVFFADLSLSRRLKRSDMLTWYSPSEKPDLGGREQDDNKHDLEELVNPEINVPGNYPTVCIELDIWDLALNTLMQSNMFNEFESSLASVAEAKGHLLDHHLKAVDSSDKELTVLGSLTSMDESRISTVTFGIIRNMVRSWSEEVAKRNRIASTMLEHLYRWMTSTSSRMYDPAINSLVHDLMKRVFIHLIADMKNFGSQVVFASFNKIVLATSKTEIPNAISYVSYLLHTLQKKELFAYVDIKPTQVWEHLIWMDPFNFGGIVCENPESVMSSENVPVDGESPLTCRTAVDFRWNMAEYLPPACKKQFIKVVAEYVFEMHHFKDAQREAKPGSQTNSQPTGKKMLKHAPPGKSQEEVSEFMKHLLNTTMKRRLLAVVRQIQRQEVDEEDEDDEAPFEFPLLPGSHLIMRNPALEFIKLVCKFFSLDPSVGRESRLLRRDLLNLIGVREFSQDSNFANPCETFSLPQVICDFCNHCQDLDLTREEDATVEGDEEMDSIRQKSWSCSVCHTLYDKVGIEQRLINIVRKRLLMWQLQDLKCERCKLVRAEEIRENCAECSGKLSTELDRPEFLRRMKVFSNISEYYEMDMLKEVMEWVIASV